MHAGTRHGDDDGETARMQNMAWRVSLGKRERMRKRLQSKRAEKRTLRPAAPRHTRKAMQHDGITG
jgi:hypothetical protein